MSKLSAVKTIQEALKEKGAVFMDGTSSKKTYLKIATKYDLSLGIRPLIEPTGQDTIWVGFRIRSVSSGDQAQMSERKKKQMMEALAGAWPGIKFTKQDNVRASTMFFVSLNRTPEEAAQIPHDLKKIRFFHKLLAFLHDVVDQKEFLVSDDDLKDYCESVYMDFVAQITGYLNPKVQLGLLEKNYLAQKAALEAKVADLEAQGKDLDVATDPDNKPATDHQATDLKHITELTGETKAKKFGAITGGKTEADDFDDGAEVPGESKTSSGSLKLISNSDVAKDGDIPAEAVVEDLEPEDDEDEDTPDVEPGDDQDEKAD